jgi:hypothetical protein
MALASLCAVGAVPDMWVNPPTDVIAVEIAPPLDKTGNFVVSPRTTWADVPAYQTREGVPHGRLVQFQVPSTASDLYPGIAGATPGTSGSTCRLDTWKAPCCR